VLNQFLKNADGMEMVEWAVVAVTFAAVLATAWSPVAAAVTVFLGIIASSV